MNFLKPGTEKHMKASGSEKSMVWKDRLSWLYSLLDNPLVYRLNQMLGKPTKRRHLHALSLSMANSPGTRVLEIACGVGSEMKFKSDFYCGTDLNARSVAHAALTRQGVYAAMDCTKLGFVPCCFDHVVSVATMHHLNNAEVAEMVSESLRVCRPGGSVHIVDAIFPVSPIKSFKRFWFNIDRGRYPRSLENLTAAIGHKDITTVGDVTHGPLHDVVFFRLTPQEVKLPS